MEINLIDSMSALAHPQRMEVFRLLVRRCPDALPAGEIARVLGLKASTASVYLSALARTGLIDQTRAGTSLRYSLNLNAARNMIGGLLQDCCNGRPDLCPPEGHLPANRKARVLFLCWGNSARSIFAEALLRDIAPDRFEVHSAGTQPFSELNPDTLRVLAGRGIDTSGLSAKSVAMYRAPEAPQMDFVFTVCDRAANADAANLPGAPMMAHWGLPDPVGAGPAAFEETCAGMNARLVAFAGLPLTSIGRARLQEHLDDIGRMRVSS